MYTFCAKRINIEHPHHDGGGGGGEKKVMFVYGKYLTRVAANKCK